MTACLALYIARVVKGPSVWDRLLGLNLVFTKTILIILLFASLHETAYLLDVAVTYALLGFISIIFVALFLLERTRAGEKK